MEEHQSPVAIRRLRSGRKMNTPSSSVSSTKRKRRRDDEKKDRNEDHDDDDNDDEDDDSQSISSSMTSQSYNHHGDGTHSPSKSDESTMRSTKVRRRLFNRLEMVNEEEEVDSAVVVVETVQEKTLQKRKRKHDNMIRTAEEEEQEGIGGDKVEKQSAKKKKKAAQSKVYTSIHDENLGKDKSLDEDTSCSHVSNKIPSPSSAKNASKNVMEKTMTELTSPKKDAITHVPVQSLAQATNTTTKISTLDHTFTVGQRREGPELSIRYSSTDSEIEKLHLHDPTTEEVEIAQKDREEGRKDGLFHKYFSVSSERDGRKTVTKLAILIFFLHFSLVILLNGNGNSITPYTLILPFCLFTDMNAATNMALTTYQRWGVFKNHEYVLPKIIEQEIIQEDQENEIELVDNMELEAEQLDLEKKNKEKKEFQMDKNNLNQLLETLLLALEQTKGSSQIETKLKEISDQHVLVRQKLLVYKERLESVKLELKRLQNSSLKAGKLDTESLREVDYFGLFNSSLNLHYFDDIRIPGENCSGESLRWLDSDSKEFATMDDLNTRLTEYTEAVSNMYRSIYDEDEEEGYRTSLPQVAQWIDEVVLNISTKFDMNGTIDLTDIMIPNKNDTSTVNNVLTVRMLKDMISRHIEIDRADRTGKYDYASLRSGAKVIQSGSRRTSVSLVESLPLVNQLLSKLSLRFYGHGANAALQPSFPDNAPGQCWSFTKESETIKIAPKVLSIEDHSIHEEDRGEYATLTVQLADPIFVESVVIEHPYVKTFSNRDTAIRKFRVLGFQDKLAIGEVWNLGEFEFVSESNEFAQEFAVRSQFDDGRTIPPLYSIMLAIDSNWGAEYSCLYRFRVQGKYANS